MERERERETYIGIELAKGSSRSVEILGKHWEGLQSR